MQNESRPQNKTLSRQLMKMLPANIVKTMDVIDEQKLARAAELELPARRRDGHSGSRSPPDLTRGGVTP